MSKSVWELAEWLYHEDSTMDYPSTGWNELSVVMKDHYYTKATALYHRIKRGSNVQGKDRKLGKGSV